MKDKVEPVVFLLFAGMMFFTAALFVCEHFFPNDGQMFQVVAQLLSGISGAFFMRIKPTQNDPKPMNQTLTATDPAGGVAATATTSIGAEQPAPVAPVVAKQ